MFLSPEISAELAPFQSLFTASTWEKVLILLVGTLLARGRRTVTAELRHMGLSGSPTFSLYHHVLNRARWSALAASRQLLTVLGHTFVALGGALTFVITPPRAARSWDLPVLSAPATMPEMSQRLGQRHKSIAQYARQMILMVRRWMPTADLTIVGDQTYSVLELGNACARRGVRLITPLRLDAALYAPAPPRVPGTNGRPRVKGERLPTLEHMLHDAQTSWQQVRVQ